MKKVSVIIMIICISISILKLVWILEASYKEYINNGYRIYSTGTVVNPENINFYNGTVGDRDYLFPVSFINKSDTEVYIYNYQNDYCSLCYVNGDTVLCAIDVSVDDLYISPESLNYLDGRKKLSRGEYFIRNIKLSRKELRTPYLITPKEREINSVFKRLLIFLLLDSIILIPCMKIKNKKSFIYIISIIINIYCSISIIFNVLYINVL